MDFLKVEPPRVVPCPPVYTTFIHTTSQNTPPSVLACSRMIRPCVRKVPSSNTLKNMQNFLDKLQDWLTQWRIAINVDKSQAIIFRKWGVIDPSFQLTLFEDNIQWVSVVRYLGLHMDSRLTYKKHIDYLSEKFWGRIHLAISLVGRNSPLSLENKVILYKQVLRPIITYASPVWGAAAATHMKKIQVIQNKILRLITNAPWYKRLRRWHLKILISVPFRVCDMYFSFSVFRLSNQRAAKSVCSQLASLNKNNALREIKLRLSYLQGESTTMSVIAHQTEKEWISANEKSRQRMSQTQAEGAAKQHAARLEEAHLPAHHSCFTTSAHLRQT
ncbi:RNA-directed DNA polymerase from mobile element jockey [Trichonephila clavipes]|nr:RNA-directed DNA polymerase from mobile element jockey [Trichonephila clavipes]